MSQDSPGAVALTTKVILEPDDSQRLAALCGPFDQNLKHLEKRLGVLIRNRGNVFQVSGPERRLKAASALLSQLYRDTAERDDIDPDVVHLYLQDAGVDELLAREAETGGAAASGSDAPV